MFKGSCGTSCIKICPPTCNNFNMGKPIRNKRCPPADPIPTPGLLLIRSSFMSFKGIPDVPLLSTQVIPTIIHNSTNNISLIINGSLNMPHDGKDSTIPDGNIEVLISVTLSEFININSFSGIGNGSLQLESPGKFEQLAVSLHLVSVVHMGNNNYNILFIVLKGNTKPTIKYNAYLSYTLHIIFQ